MPPLSAARAPLAAAAAIAPVLVAVASSPLDGYIDASALDARISSLASERSDLVELIRIGETREGRRIAALRLGRNGDSARFPALLLVSGLDGTHLVGPEVALRVAEGLVRDHPALLEDAVIYVVPAVNLDAIARTHANPGAPVSRNLRPIDDDRDGVADEDGPDDLDGNGIITLMRVRDPAPPERATLVVDPEEPRLLRPADPLKGERPIYRLLIEGIDGDGDGLLSEDPIGGVDLDRNFMHRWPELEDGAGPYPLSEPESLALARFVIDRPEIVLGLTWGRHDTLIAVPDGRGTDVNPRVPAALDPADVATHAALATLYRDTTGQARAAGADSAGAFHAWLYAQRGAISLASTIWGRPDVPAPDAPEAQPADFAGGPVRGADAAQPPTTSGEAAEATPSAAPEPRRRRGGGPPPGAPRTARPPSGEIATGDLAEDRAWLAWADHAGTGFVSWTPIEHPTLGPVEVGGFMPLFRITPPASELDALAARQLAFVVELLGRMPRLAIEGPDVERIGEGVYSVRMTIANEGRLPLGSALGAREQFSSPLVVRLSAPAKAGISGQRVRRIRGLAPGSSERLEWIVRGTPGERIGTIVLHPGGEAGRREELREVVLPSSGSARFESEQAR
ncbi:MAG TPA: M14 family zinc carboxypeptidase [Phycisphaerales bacterium]|nr:M14 family zinc carboxypeptidase [Phycisphaerales bacterium]HMP38457.1 M14 family zinc carboxypeptidase [Phycisphaerales bacterium]